MRIPAIFGAIRRGAAALELDALAALTLELARVTSLLVRARLFIRRDDVCVRGVDAEKRDADGEKERGEFRRARDHGFHPVVDELRTAVNTDERAPKVTLVTVTGNSVEPYRVP